MDTILEKIHKAALRFLIPLTPEETYVTIGQEAVKLVGGEHSTIYLVKEKELERVYSSIQSLFKISGQEKDIRYEVIRTGKSAVLSLDLMKKLKKKYPFMSEVYDRSAIMIPLSYKDRAIGLLSVMALKDSNFTRREMDILSLFGSLASLAIRKTQLYDETKQALEIRDLFISMAAHEFRTPITTIGGYAQMLKLRIKKEGSEKRWVEEIYKETQRLVRLVNELLEINRIKTGQLQYNWQECSLYMLVNEAVDVFRISHPECQINFKAEVDEVESVIVGDYDKLMQVLTNVLDNAAKFSPVDKTVSINLREKNDELIVQIRDQGVGIAKKDLDKVFEGFYRGTNNTKEGMGLGLYISYKIVKEHRGKIHIRSKINQGTTVEIRLPRTPIRKK